MAEVHAAAKAITIPADGTFPYWTTVCGKRLDEKAIGITSNSGDVTCAVCAAAGKRGKRGLKAVK